MQFIAATHAESRDGPVGNPRLVQLALVEHGEERDEHVAGDGGLDAGGELGGGLRVDAVVDGDVAATHVLALDEPLGVRGVGVRLERVEERVHACRLGQVVVHLARRLALGGEVRAGDRQGKGQAGVATHARSLEQAVVVDERLRARRGGIGRLVGGRGSRELGRIVQRLRGRPVEGETLRVARGRRLLKDDDALLAHVEERRRRARRCDPDEGTAARGRQRAAENRQAQRAGSILYSRLRRTSISPAYGRSTT